MKLGLNPDISDPQVEILSTPLSPSSTYYIITPCFRTGYLEAEPETRILKRRISRGSVLRMGVREVGETGETLSKDIIQFLQLELIQPGTRNTFQNSSHPEARESDFGTLASQSLSVVIPLAEGGCERCHISAVTVWKKAGLWRRRWLYVVNSWRMGRAAQGR